LLESFLANRWRRIDGSFFDYTADPEFPVNRFCIALANYLHHHVKNQGAPESVKGIYQYLIPSLKFIVDQLDILEKAHIDEYPLNACILSEDKTALIPVVDVLRWVDYQGGMTLDQLLVNPYTEAPFTQKEQIRMIQHSKYTKALADCLQEIINTKAHTDTLGAQLETLVKALRAGGKTRDRTATEYQAGDAAARG